MLRGLVIVAVLAGAVAPTGAREQGRALYVEHCADCHGDEGRGDGPKSVRLGFKPRDLTIGSYKCRCTASGDLPTDADLRRSVTDGLAGTAMAGFGDELSADDLSAVVQHIKRFSARFSAEPGPTCIELPAPPADGLSTEIGEHVYRLLQCWQCHGERGRGDGPAAKGLKDDWGRRSRPGRFAANGKFKCGGTRQDLYRTLHTGITGTPMPSYAAVFLFDAELAGALGAVEETFGPDATAPIRNWLGTQPDAAAIDAMDLAERRALVDARTWALVDYVLSLTPQR